MEDERVAAVSVDEPVLRPPPQTGHARASQALAKILRQRTSQIRPPRFDARDAPALEDALETADGRLDFGKLWHAPAIWRRRGNPARAAHP